MARCHRKPGVGRQAAQIANPKPQIPTPHGCSNEGCDVPVSHIVGFATRLPVCSTVFPLALLGGVWAFTLAVWGLAWVEVGGGALGDLQRGLRAYCFGWDPDGSSGALAATAIMAGVPVALTVVVLLVWGAELFRVRSGRVGLAALSIGTAVALVLLAIAGRSVPAGSGPAPVPADAREACREFILTDADGAPFSLADARGKVVCLTFFYTRCTHTCPGQMRKLIALQQALPDALGRDLLLVAISLDPVRDDGAALREYGVRLGADRDGWRFLRGSRAGIESLLEHYGVAFGLPREIRPTTQIGHSALIVAVDRRGRRAQDFYGTDYPDESLIAEVSRLIEE